MKGYLPFQKPCLHCMCRQGFSACRETRVCSKQRTVVSHILARFLCSQTGYPALMASRTERLHSSLSRTWKTPKPSMGIFCPLCKVADGFRGDGVGLIITSWKPPTTTTTPSPPPVRTGRSLTKRLVYLAKYPQGIALGIFLSYSLAEIGYSALFTSFLPLRFRTDLPLLV